MDTGFRNISNDLAADLFKNADGTRGQIASISSGVITLTNPNDVVQFEVGMSLVSYSITAGTYIISTGGAVGYVIAVNRSTGVVTVSATQGGSAGTPSTWSTSFPNLAVQGDTVASASPGTAGTTSNFLKVSGLAAWLNSQNIASTDSFWNVNRYTDITRLGGVYFNGAGESIEEALIDGAALVSREGGMPDMCFMNFASYSALEKSLGAKVQYVDVKHDEADIAFSGIRIHGPYGTITVVPDRNCQAQTAYLLQMDKPSVH
jgi:Family of unknown function (DUF5309)